MPGIAGPPTPVQIHLKPCTEIHWAGNRWYPNVAQIARGIARGDVHGAAKCDRQVLKVAAHALFLHRDIQRCLCGTGKSIPECYLGMHPIEDSLHTRPSFRCVSEKLPRESRELIDFAIPACEQELN